mgnify:CR=1 FL=1
MPIVRFSKPSIAVIKNKTSFFEENDRHLNYVREVNNFYLQQPQRKVCKTCGTPLDKKDLTVHKVPYSVCKNCGHLNGMHEDTNEFANFLYSQSGGENYSKNYKNDYLERVEDIYRPKVQFLIEVLNQEKISDFSVTDLGCGGGHFVKACELEQIEAIGFDTNQQLIDLGNTILESNKVYYEDLSKIDELILQNQNDVLSLVGVLEHLLEPISAIEAFNKSSATYLYLQVPLFSLSVLLESMHPDVFPRQLNAGHTHLYTDSSIDYICKEHRLEKVGEWWFGTDMVDLFRHLHIKTESDSDIKDEMISNFIGDFIDPLQTILDQKKVCSGVNMVLKKNKKI